MNPVPDHLTVRGGRAVALTDLVMAENRLFQVTATADPIVFFGDDSPVAPPAPGEPMPPVTVQLDGNGSAAEFGTWILDSVTVLCTAHRYAVTYYADLEMAHDVAAADLAEAPAGLQDLLAQLLAYEPAALASSAALLLAEPSPLRALLVERAARVLSSADCAPVVPCLPDLVQLVDALLEVLVEQLPPRPVVFRITGTAAEALAADPAARRADLTV